MNGDQLFLVAVLAVVVVPVTGIMTTILVQGFQVYVTWRQRINDRADRQEVVHQAKLATEAAATAARVATSALGVVHSAVIQVGIKADAAYNEANNANVKIQNVSDKLATALNLPAEKVVNTPDTVLEEKRG